MEELEVQRRSSKQKFVDLEADIRDLDSLKHQVDLLVDDIDTDAQQLRDACDVLQADLWEMGDVQVDYEEKRDELAMTCEDLEEQLE